jgi:hypothetical protein
VRRLNAGNLLLGQQCQQAQQPAHVRVCLPQQELVQGMVAGQTLVQPHRGSPDRRLAKLFAVGADKQRHR